MQIIMGGRHHRGGRRSKRQADPLPHRLTSDPRRLAIVGTLALRTGTLFSVRGRNIEGSFNADYTLADPGATNRKSTTSVAANPVPTDMPATVALLANELAAVVFAS